MSRLVYNTNGGRYSISFRDTGGSTAHIKIGKHSYLGQSFHGEIVPGSVLTFTFENDDPERPVKCEIASPPNTIEDNYYYEFDVINVVFSATVLPEGINQINTKPFINVFTSAGATSATAPPASHTIGSHTNVNANLDTAGAGDDQKAVVWDNASGQYVLGSVDPTAGANVGGQTGQVFRDKTGTTLNFKTLQSSDSSVTITNNADDINLVVNDANVTHALGAGQSNVNNSADAPANNSNSLFWNTTEWAERQPAMTDLSDTDHSGATKLDGTVLRYDITTNTYSHRPPTTRPLRQTKVPEQTGSAQTGRFYWLNPSFKIHQADRMFSVVDGNIATLPIGTTVTIVDADNVNNYIKGIIDSAPTFHPVEELYEYTLKDIKNLGSFANNAILSFEYEQHDSNAGNPERFVGFKYQYESTFGVPTDGQFMINTPVGVDNDELRISKNDIDGNPITPSYVTDSGFLCDWIFWSTDNHNLSYRFRRETETLNDNGTYWSLTGLTLALTPFADAENLLFTIDSSIIKTLGDITDVNTAGAVANVSVLGYDGSDWVPQNRTTDTAAGEAYEYTATTGTPSANGEITITGGNTLNIHINNLDGTQGFINSLDGIPVPRLDGYFITLYHQTSHGDSLLISMDETTAVTNNTTYLTFTPVTIVTTGATAPPWNSYLHYQNNVALETLGNVQISGVTDGQVITYEASTQLWKNTTPSAGVDTLVDLTDTAIPALSYADISTESPIPQNRWRSDQLTDASTWTDDINSRQPTNSSGIPTGPVSIGANARNAVNVDNDTDVYELQIEPLTDVFTVMLVLEDVLPNASLGQNFFTTSDSGAGNDVLRYWSQLVNNSNNLLAIHNDGVTQVSYTITDPGFPVQNDSVNTPIVVTFTSDGTTGRAYINGTLRGSGAMVLGITGQDRIRVLGQEVTTRRGRGQIGEVIVWNSALSAGDIATRSTTLLEYFHNAGVTDGQYLRYNGSEWTNQNITVADIVDFPTDLFTGGFCVSGSSGTTQGPNRIRISGSTEIRVSYDSTVTDGWTEYVTSSLGERLDSRLGKIYIIENGTFIQWEYRFTDASTWTDIAGLGNTREVTLGSLTLSHGPNPFTGQIEGNQYHVMFARDNISNIAEHQDVVITAPATTNYLGYDGVNWINRQVNYSELTGTPPASFEVGHHTTLNTAGFPTANGQWRLNVTVLEINKNTADGTVMPTPQVNQRFAFYERTGTGRASIFTTFPSSVVTDAGTYWSISVINAEINQCVNGDVTQYIQTNYNKELEWLQDVNINAVFQYDKLTWDGVGEWINQAPEYAGCRLVNNVTNTPLAVQNTWYPYPQSTETATTLFVKSAGFDDDGGTSNSIRWLGATGRVASYTVTICCDNPGTGTNVYEFSLQNKAQTATYDTMCRSIANNSVGSVALSGIINLTNNEVYRVNFRNTTDSDGILISHMHFGMTVVN